MIRKNAISGLIGLALMAGLCPATYSDSGCQDILQHTMKRLHSSESINLCQEFSGKPVVIVNTASHCGFTPQFKALEEIYQRYQPQGVGFLGVSSNSFFQAAASEQQAAEVCYLNYGVSFPMAAPVEVTGNDAHPLFAELARQSAAPKWNFFKYVVDKDGNVAGRFSSAVKPDDQKITSLLDRLVAED